MSKPRRRQKRTYVSSQGVTFLENGDAAIKVSGIKNFDIYNWCFVGSGDLEFISRIKFQIVRWLYRDLFDTQLKQKGRRYGLKIIRKRPRGKING